MDLGLAIDNLSENMKSGLKDGQRASKEVRECEYQRKGIPGRRNSRFLEKAAVQ